MKCTIKDVIEVWFHLKVLKKPNSSEGSELFDGEELNWDARESDYEDEDQNPVWYWSW